MAITGGCLCRAVRFTIDAEAPIAVRQCWCRDCQYFGAGSCTVNAIFRTEAVEASGPLTEFVRNADSGSVMRRHFCAQCGTQVFSVAEPRAHLTIVRVGALDDPETAAPQGIIWTKSAPRWACFDPALSQTEGQPTAAPAPR